MADRRATLHGKADFRLNSRAFSKKGPFSLQLPLVFYRAAALQALQALLENLVVVPHCAHKPHTKGGRASSLIRRHDADRALLAALADNPHPTIAGLSRLIGCSEARTSAHLGKVAERGLTASPMCVPGRSWVLTGEGLAVAMDERPLIDNTDRDILAVISRSPTKLVSLAKAIGACNLTARRRVNLLTQEDLVEAQPDGRLSITDAGRQALGADDAPRPAPWFRVEAISAALSRDVRERSPTDDRSSAFRARIAKMGAQAGAAATRLRKRERFAFGDLDMAG